MLFGAVLLVNVPAVLVVVSIGVVVVVVVDEEVVEAAVPRVVEPLVGVQRPPAAEVQPRAEVGAPPHCLVSFWPVPKGVTFSMPSQGGRALSPFGAG